MYGGHPERDAGILIGVLIGKYNEPENTAIS